MVKKMNAGKKLALRAVAFNASFSPGFVFCYSLYLNSSRNALEMKKM